MKIATFVNGGGDVADFYEKGKLCRYEQISGEWRITREIALDINEDMNLLETKALFFTAMSQLDDCKVFLVKKFKGLFHALLMEELGFHTWKSAGPLREQLDNVVLQEKEYVAELEKQALANIGKPPVRSAGHGGCGGGCSSRATAPRGPSCEPCGVNPDIPLPLLLGDIEEGRYLIHLAQILQDNPALNSRQIVIPALEEKNFKTLEIICDHIPRWFYNELRNLKLTAEPEVPDESGQWLKVVVSPT
ncbi:MAG: Fe-only nitrogenase accessory protein AnfO [Desulfuromonadaceae bacterium]|nr:Fe-only nitrogenase accessory protein AnfO [Desulfuromonadaceae bacterium]MDD2847231.1 Fe-only nitrogenase accessory protein AnfO [Desulfuromonadaceae bacterium]MDD4130175.1 Fe-only nitrogenase accessory protein AnfO [Desulfuromonadaceae bacterium]